MVVDYNLASTLIVGILAADIIKAAVTFAVKVWTEDFITHNYT